MNLDSSNTCLIRCAGVSSKESRRRAARLAFPSGVQFPVSLGFTTETVQREVVEGERSARPGPRSVWAIFGRG